MRKFFGFARIILLVLRFAQEPRFLAEAPHVFLGGRVLILCLVCLLCPEAEGMDGLFMQ